jgi:hypothetical protein
MRANGLSVFPPHGKDFPIIFSKKLSQSEFKEQGVGLLKAQILTEPSVVHNIKNTFFIPNKY